MDTYYLQSIVANLPYGGGFCFVDRIEELSDTHIKGLYHFNETAYFYTHHFKDRPVTPGVILIECMAQIGLVCLGTHLYRDNPDIKTFLFSESHVLFNGVVLPETTVKVSATIIYNRFNKLKVDVIMQNPAGDLVASGWLSGVAVK